MAIDSVAALVAVLRESRLLRPEHLDQLTPELLARFSEPKDLARHLMRLDWLTPYQINQLFQGNGKDLVLGPYRLVERLGEGGMGQVFKAVHQGLDRVVALKVIRKEHVRNPDAVRRFHREIRAAAQLSHPNIVMAYDADSVDGAHFFAMEYVNGIDLLRLVKESGPLSIEHACEYIRQAALGLQHAFECGLVHRDIKPANLLLSNPPGRGKKSSGSDLRSTGTSSFHRIPVVKILDMGLARLQHPLESDDSMSALTQEGRVIGTPDFMAPEQATNSHTTDIRADLYSLGCTFYYLLTGKAPFPGGTFMEKLLKHRLDTPAPVEKLRPEVPPRVGAIVRKLLAKRPEERFQTPAELAAALAALNEPVSSTSLPRSTPAGATPTSVPSAAAVVATVPPKAVQAPIVETLVSEDEGPAASRPMASAARRNRLAARQRRRAGRKWFKRAIAIVMGALLLSGLVAVLLWVVNNLLFLGKHGHDGTDQDHEQAGTSDLDALKRASSGPEDYRQRLLDFRYQHGASTDALRAAEILMALPSPLDRLDARMIPLEERGTWSAPELVGILGESQPPRSVTAVAWAPHSRLLAAAVDAGVELWDMLGTQPHARGTLRRQQGPVLALAFARDGKTLAAAGQDGVVALWKPNDPRQVPVLLRGHTQTVTALAYSPDGKLLASGSRDKSVRLWDASGARPVPLAVLTEHSEGIAAFAFAPDGKVLAAGCLDGAVRFWDLTRPQPIARPTLKTGLQPLEALAFSPDGRTLAAAGSEGTLVLWSMASGQPEERRSLAGHERTVTALVFALDGRTLVSAGEDGQVIVWSVARGELRLGWTLPGPVHGLALALDGRHLATANGNGTVYILRLAGPVAGAG